MSKDIKDMSDKKLCRIVRAGKKDAHSAFEELYNRYANRVYTYCYAILEDIDFANDIFQETFIKLYDVIQTKNDIDNVASYIMTITRNLCLNEKAKKVNNMLPLDNDNLLSFSDNSFEKKEMKEIVDRALRLLSNTEREVIIMHEYLDLNYRQMSDIIGIAESTLRTRLFRARVSLREILIPLLKDFENDKDEIK